MSILSATKCVLLLSDDALYVYKVTGAGVSLVNSFAWRMPDFESDVAAALSRTVGDGNVYILNDTVEQHYRKEKINLLNAFDRNSIISRRLNIAFPSYPTRASLELKDKTKRHTSKEKLFLFTAVPSTEGLRKLLEAIKRSEATIQSYCLLPVESIDLVDKIAAKVAKENRQLDKSDWSILISQHRGGGLRQIVTRNKQIALTRITPIIAPQPENAAQWASDVVQEIQSTISYLGRFGYSQNDGLDIVFIGKPEFGALVEDLINFQCQFNVLTLQRAAELASISVGRQQDGEFGDALHVAWFVKKLRPVLPMRSKDIDAVALPRKVALYGMLLLSAGLAYSSYSVSNEVQSLYAANKNLAIVEEMKVEAEKIYQDELAKKQSFGIDVKLIQGSLGVYGEMNKLSFDPLPLLKVVGDELKNLRLNQVSLEGETPTLSGATSPDAAAQPDPSAAPSKVVKVVLTLTFPGTIAPDKGNHEVEELVKRLSKGLDQTYTVTLAKQLMDTTYKGEFSDETGFNANKRSATDSYIAEIEIQKDIKNVASTGSQ